jgi:hypothetical protein
MRLSESARAEDKVFNAWFKLRRIGAVYAAQGHGRLCARDQQQLVEALQVAHVVAHNADPFDFEPLSKCNCETADLARLLVTLNAVEIEERHAA